MARRLPLAWSSAASLWRSCWGGRDGPSILPALVWSVSSAGIQGAGPGNLRAFAAAAPAGGADAGRPWALRRGRGKLEDLIDTHRKTPQDPVVAGKSWPAAELRRKSMADLHKLWYVLLLERIKLQTEHRAHMQQRRSDREPPKFPAPDRYRRVKRSMGRIKHVLTERAIELRNRGDVALAEEMEKAINQW